MLSRTLQRSSRCLPSDPFAALCLEIQGSDAASASARSPSNARHLSQAVSSALSRQSLAKRQDLAWHASIARAAGQPGASAAAVLLCRHMTQQRTLSSGGAEDRWPFNTFKGAFKGAFAPAEKADRAAEPAAAAVAEPLDEGPTVLSDYELLKIDEIIELSSPANMDLLTWPVIYSSAWVHTWCAERLLGSLHDSLGLTWVATIPIAVVVLRTAMAPFMVQMQIQAYKMGKAKPALEAAQRDMIASIQRGVPGPDAQKEYTRRVYKLYGETGASPMNLLVPLGIQLPVMTGFYFGLMGICANSLPSMVIDGYAGMGVDLTQVDPKRMLNMAVPATLMGQLYFTVSHNWVTLTEQQRVLAKWGLVMAPPVLTAAMWSFPAAICYYWALSNVYSMGMELTLRVPRVRRAVGLPSRQALIDLALEQRKKVEEGGGFLNSMLGIPSTEPAQTAAPLPATAGAQSLQAPVSSATVAPSGMQPAASQPSHASDTASSDGKAAAVLKTKPVRSWQQGGQAAGTGARASQGTPGKTSRKGGKGRRKLHTQAFPLLESDVRNS